MIKNRLVFRIKHQLLIDKFIWNEFELLSITKLPRRGEVGLLGR